MQQSHLKESARKVTDKKQRKQKNVQEDEEQIFDYLMSDGETINNDFYPTQDYLGYKMFFLSAPINYSFWVSVPLLQTKYSIQVKNVSEADIKSINGLLCQIHEDLKMTSRSVFMNAKTTVFKDGSYPPQPIHYQADRSWRIRIQIQGYKTGESGHPSPIWRIIEAQLSG